MITRGAGTIVGIVPMAEIKPKGQGAPTGVRIEPGEGQTIHVVTLSETLKKMPFPTLARSFLMKDGKLVSAPNQFPPPNKP